jgi:hypothetical protein
MRRSRQWHLGPLGAFKINTEKECECEGRGEYIHDAGVRVAGSLATSEHESADKKCRLAAVFCESAEGGGGQPVAADGELDWVACSENGEGPGRHGG